MNTHAAASSLPLWILAVEWVSRGVLLLLIMLSVWSVALMVDRFRVFQTAQSGNLEKVRSLILANNFEALQDWLKQHSESVALATLRTAVETPHRSAEAIDRSVRSFLATERNRLERGLTPLATLGSNAPFIGLFGTVLGIIQAFGALAAQSSNSQSVMTGISEALVATAIGLFVAIPAVVAYNIFSRKLKVILVESESLRDLYLSRILSATEQTHGG